MKIELECKVPIPERASIAKRLAALGAQDHGDRHERNWVFDTPNQELKSKGMLLRLRTLGDEKKALLTVKRPGTETAFKSRVESEVYLDSVEAGRLVLETLGYELNWFYEKRRHTWTLPACEVLLDELPEIGCYIEIEAGDEQTIRSALTSLTLDPETHVEDNYRTLFENHRARQGLPMSNMEFDKETA